MSDLEQAFLRATQRAIYKEGKPGILGRADGVTVYFVLPNGNTDYGRVWARYNSGNAPAIEAVVRNGGVPAVVGLPVRIIDRNGDAVAVIETDPALIGEFTGGGNWVPLALHGQTHRRLGTDPRYVEGLAFEPLMVRPSSPPALTVYVEPGWYRYGGVRDVWEGGDSGSLSAYLPASSGVHHFVIIALDRSDNSIDIIDGSDIIGGDIYTAAETVTYAEIEAVAIADNYYPLAVVLLYYGQTAVMVPDITHDLRLWGGDAALSHPLVTAESTILTIATGAVTATSDYHIIAAESGTVDNLDTITAAADRQILVVQADTGDTITVKHGVDNITLNGEADFELSADKTLLLFYDGTNWSDAGAGGGGVSAGVSKTVQTHTILFSDTLASPAANIDITSISQDYNHILLRVRSRSSNASASVSLNMTFNGDATTTNYRNTYLLRNFGAVASGDTTSTQIGYMPAASATYTNAWGHNEILIKNYTDSYNKVAFNAHLHAAWQSNESQVGSRAIQWLSTAAITQITIAPATGNFIADTYVELIGIKEEAIGGAASSVANVSSPPTDAELDAEFGTPAAVGAGFLALIDDGGADTDVWLAASSGTSWWYTGLTKAA